jgi:hypothetical protein
MYVMSDYPDGREYSKDEIKVGAEAWQPPPCKVCRRLVCLTLFQGTHKLTESCASQQYDCLSHTYAQTRVLQYWCDGAAVASTACNVLRLSVSQQATAVGCVATQPLQDKAV